MSNVELKYKGIVVGNKKFLCGKLYLKEFGNKELKVFNENEFRTIFDTCSNNFHLFPCNRDEDDRIGEIVKNRITDVIGELEKKHNVEILQTKKETSDRLQNVENDKILVYTNNRNGTLKYQKNTVSRIYRFITAYKNGVKYELNFMRFFIDKGSSVNCILNSLQFDRVLGNDLKSLPDTSLNKGKICYPESYEDLELEQLGQVLKKQENFCFNPKVRFENEPGSIADEFISFINQCEKMENEEKD